MTKVRRARSSGGRVTPEGVLRRLGLCVVALLLLAMPGAWGCGRSESSATAEAVIRVFVDVDGDGALGPDDIPVPDVNVGVNTTGDTLPTDAEGAVTFGQVPYGLNRFSLAGGEAQRLRESGFPPMVETQDVHVEGDIEAEFPLQVVGFVDVEVDATSSGE